MLHLTAVVRRALSTASRSLRVPPLRTDFIASVVVSGCPVVLLICATIIEMPQTITGVT